MTLLNAVQIVYCVLTSKNMHCYYGLKAALKLLITNKH